MGFALSELQLKSEAFEPGGKIPQKYSGEGEDVSPPLEWSSVPLLKRVHPRYKRRGKIYYGGFLPVKVFEQDHNKKIRR